MNRYYGPNWKEQREKCLERDGHECVSCERFTDEFADRRGGDLHVHHKLPVSVFEAECDDIPWAVVNDLNNLVTLCASCHSVIESCNSHSDIDFGISGEVRDEYLYHKPSNMTHNKFVQKLLNDASLDGGESSQEIKRVRAYREMEHDIRAMIRDELEQFARKYLEPGAGR